MCVRLPPKIEYSKHNRTQRHPYTNIPIVLQRTHTHTNKHTSTNTIIKLLLINIVLKKQQQLNINKRVKIQNGSKLVYFLGFLGFGEGVNPCLPPPFIYVYMYDRCNT